jgi:hypothetical protein
MGDKLTGFEWRIETMIDAVFVVACLIILGVISWYVEKQKDY